MRTVRRFTPWIAASLLLSILLPHGPDNDLRFSSAYAQENQPTFIGGLLNPLAFNQPITAVEIPEKRTEKSAVFDLGGRKRAAVSLGAPLFVKKNNEWIPIEAKGYFHANTYVFDRLADGVEVRFDLTTTSYTLSQNGHSYTMTFDTGAEGTVVDDHTVSYRLNDGAMLQWTVEGNKVKKEIMIERVGAANNISFSITASDNLTMRPRGNTFEMRNTEGETVFMTDAPYLTTTDLLPIERDVTIAKHNEGYRYVYNEDGLSFPYILDPSSGPNNPATLTSEVNSGNFPNCSVFSSWTNPGNAAASDNVYAVSSGTNGGSYCIAGVNFGFAIDSGATIDGIVASIERKCSVSGSSNCKDASVYLVKAGSQQGSDKGDTATQWPTSDGTATYGSSSDLWGLTLTPSDVNASNFGFTLSLTFLQPAR